jgi:A/G-specific adenine glycosylase
MKGRALSKGLLRWFDKNGRSFPWRETFEKPDPYIVLFTEIMLQRTKADQVVPVYQDFIRKYPTFRQMSTASKREIFLFFKKLGLTWRANNVVKLVETLKEKFDGEVPSRTEDLEDLPGVGRYVPDAVACYAFGSRRVPVDSNVARVISRLFDLKIDADSARRNARVIQLAGKLLPESRSRDFNLALLDFSAAVCKPTPLCGICPLRMNCGYYARSIVSAGD